MSEPLEIVLGAGAIVSIGALPSTDSHTCRCDRLPEFTCRARPTEEDGLCRACRQGCDITSAGGGVHMARLGVTRGDTTFKAAPPTG